MAEDREDIDALLAIIFTLSTDAINYEEAASVLGVVGPPSLPAKKVP